MKKKSLWHRILYSKFMLGVLVALSVAVAFAVYNRYIIEREVAGRRAEKEADLRQLEERKTVLESKVEKLSDEQGVEAEIRRHFDVAREGEKVVVLVGEKKEDYSSVPEPASPKPSKWQAFWSRLFSW